MPVTVESCFPLCMCDRLGLGTVCCYTEWWEKIIVYSLPRKILSMFSSNSWCFCSFMKKPGPSVGDCFCFMLFLRFTTALGRNHHFPLHSILQSMPQNLTHSILFLPRAFSSTALNVWRWRDTLLFSSTTVCGHCQVCLFWMGGHRLLFCFYVNGQNKSSLNHIWVIRFHLQHSE